MEQPVPGIANASFEACTADGGLAPCASGDGEAPDFWLHDTFSGVLRGTQTWTQAKSRTGLGSFYAYDPSYATYYTSIVTNPVIVLPRLEYEASVWLMAGDRAPADMKVWLILNYMREDGARIGQAYVATHPGTTDQWTQHVVRAVMPPDAARAEVRLFTSTGFQSHGWGGFGDYYADDVTLLPVLPI